MVMPDAQDDQGIAMYGVAHSILAEDEVANRLWIWCLSDTPPHFRKGAEVLDADNQIRRDARGSGRIMGCDELTETSKVCDRLLRIDQPHLPALGGGSSSELPHDSSQAWTAWPEATFP